MKIIFNIKKNCDVMNELFLIPHTLFETLPPNTTALASGKR